MKSAKNTWRWAAQSIGVLAIVALLGFVGGVPVFAANGNHAAIVIQSDADFTSCGCMTSGSGTTADPYIIGPWNINNLGGNAVYIDGSTLTKSFTLFDLTIAGNSAGTDTGIVLNHINLSG